MRSFCSVVNERRSQQIVNPTLEFNATFDIHAQQVRHDADGEQRSKVPDEIESAIALDNRLIQDSCARP